MAIANRPVAVISCRCAEAFEFADHTVTLTLPFESLQELISFVELELTRIARTGEGDVASLADRSPVQDVWWRSIVPRLITYGGSVRRLDRNTFERKRLTPTAIEDMCDPEKVIGYEVFYIGDEWEEWGYMYWRDHAKYVNYLRNIKRKANARIKAGMPA